MLHAAQSIQSQPQSPVFVPGRNLDEVAQSELWLLCQQQPQLPTPSLLAQVPENSSLLSVSRRHINRLRQRWALSARRGRAARSHEPGRHDLRESAGHESGGELLQLQPSRSHVGVALFADWLLMQEDYSKLERELLEAVADYAELQQPYLRIMSHRPDTIMRRFLALLLAPLYGIAKLTELDYKAHGLGEVVGTSYHSVTLRLFLADLERIDISEALMRLLADGPAPAHLAYIDGHMIALWSRHKMHKGKITMLGRIMAGSQLVVAHSAEGKALYFEYLSPDIRLSAVLMGYCERLVLQCEVSLFVVDREANSLVLAKAFAERGWGLMSMLDSSQYQGLDSFDVEPLGASDEGELYRAQWRDEDKRSKEIRHFVLLVSDSKVLVYWGTARVREVLEQRQWPEAYQQRTEVQENSFRRMIAHGALNTNDGYKKLWGPDRHQQRKRKGLEERLEKASQRSQRQAVQLAEQQEKVRESMERGHGKRLQQRQARLETEQARATELQRQRQQIQSKLEQVGEPKPRADRDFRKQKVMTFRTLLLENWLVAFFFALMPGWGSSETVSMDVLVELFLRSRGGSLETSTRMLYWIDTSTLSQPHRRMLEGLVERVNAMALLHDGKRVELRVRDGPS